MTRVPLLGLVLLVVVTAATPVSLSATPQRSQAEIARDLRSGDRDRVAKAKGEVPVMYDVEDELSWVLPPGYSPTPELVHALAQALEHEARMHLDGGTYAGPPTNLELVLELKNTVIALRDPVTIPALVQVVSTGGGARDALLAFGPRVIPDLLDWATAPDAADADVSGSLYTLTEAVRRWDDEIDAETRARIKAAAMLHLDGPPAHFASAQSRGVPLSRALGLASALGDPDFLPVLEAMAASDEEILRRTESGMGLLFGIESIRERVVATLATFKRRRSGGGGEGAI